MSYTAVNHTGTDVANYVKRQFGDEAAIQVSDEDIVRWINSGQDEIFRMNEPIKATATADTIGGQGAYTFPADVLRVQSIYVNGVPIEYKSMQNAEEYILSLDPDKVSQGVPILWYEWGGTFNLYPIPSGGTTNGIKFNYVKAPTKLNAIGDSLSVPDVYYNRLLEYVMQQAYELDENFNAAEMKSAQFMQNMQTYGERTDVMGSHYPMITVLEEDQY